MAMKDSAMLVVDVDHQNGWRPEQIAQSPALQKVSAALSKKLTATRQEAGLVVMVMSPPDFYIKNRRRDSVRPTDESQMVFDDHCRGCEGTYKLAEFLQHGHSPYAPLFVKTRDSAFTNPRLAPYLHSQRVKEVLLAGCNLFGCLLETARGAIRESFRVTLLDDCAYPLEGDDKQWWLKELESPGSAHDYLCRRFPVPDKSG